VASSHIFTTHLAHKFRHATPNDKDVQKELNNLISINIESKESIINEWLIEHFKNKLKKAATVAGTLNRPLVLYYGIIEESEGSAKEEIVLHNQKYITVQIFTRGGFLPTSFHEQYVFTIDKFISWMIKERKNREMILQCLTTVNDSI
jgi:hypothetical protein